MPSKAQDSFIKQSEDIDRLIEIHKDIGGNTRGRRYGVEVLNKSAIVLITACWEAFCEDLAAEALEHLVDTLLDPTKLPKSLKTRIAKELKEDKNNLAVWSLAESGWRSFAKARLKKINEERNWKHNSPKAGNIDDLFNLAIGLPSVSSTWNWSSMSIKNAKDKLNRYVKIRGSIAHRGGEDVYTKRQVLDYHNHIKKLASKTDSTVNEYVKKHTTKSLW